MDNTRHLWTGWVTAEYCCLDTTEFGGVAFRVISDMGLGNVYMDRDKETRRHTYQHSDRHRTIESNWDETNMDRRRHHPKNGRHKGSEVKRGR
ncbi:hypothetical protein ElyMa_003213200 [Elysia marginata]|uniref:Uncharacterized protein n=1 Tax=Elysia marginata TaxID=1093978 RepID=A0AAV4J0Z6_9GAST|nr:hypothetical protein ElyMa_003213200 [Elysia marginata]